MSPKTENYLVDLGNEIVAKALEAQRNAKNATDGFEKGRQTAFYEILSLMKQQAEAFEIDESAIGLKGVDLEQFLT